MEKSYMGIVVIAFVAILFGSVAIAQIADITVSKTQLSAVTDTVDISSARVYSYLGVTAVKNETIASHVYGTYLSKNSLKNVVCTLQIVTNATSGQPITASNYTNTNCLLNATEGTLYANSSWNVSYTYNYMNSYGAVDPAVTLSARTILSNPASTTWKNEYTDCAISSVNYYNQSGALMTSATDYTWTTDGNGAPGALTLNNVPSLNSTASNTTTISYYYCPNEYLPGWAKNVTNMIPGFFALGILAAAIWFGIWFYNRQEIE